MESSKSCAGLQVQSAARCKIHTWQHVCAVPDRSGIGQPFVFLFSVFSFHLITAFFSSWQGLFERIYPNVYWIFWGSLSIFAAPSTRSFLSNMHRNDWKLGWWSERGWCLISWAGLDCCNCMADRTSHVMRPFVPRFRSSSQSVLQARSCLNSRGPAPVGPRSWRCFLRYCRMR